SSHGLMKKHNSLLIFETILKYGPITKKELKERTNLSWGTISTVTSALLDKKILTEEKKLEHIPGRNPIDLDICQSDHLIVGIDINIDKISIVLSDTKCRTIFETYETIEKYEINAILNAIDRGIKSMADYAGGMQKITGIGIALPGNMNTLTGIWEYNYTFGEHINFPIIEELSKKYNCYVCADHDPNCIALAEQYAGVARDFSNFLMIRLSSGIGMGIVLNGKIFRGAYENAGQFGHICVSRNGPLCKCGKTGCLETYVSIKAIERTAMTVAQSSRIPTVLDKKEPLVLADVLEAARLGDAAARDILLTAAGHLGIALANIVNILNPEAVILWGELSMDEDDFVSHVRKTIFNNTADNNGMVVKASEVGAKGAAVGAAALVMQDILSGKHPLLDL
ncbi:MAG TPA: ROK family protein, partial [Anaerovoracaceae bacterium]|nr:ROK family protein [Anaerovoracaceae bacterium]